ncbi:MAG: hypothetical protein U0168_14490 [Nannocystaceae bacterium]
MTPEVEAVVVAAGADVDEQAAQLDPSRGFGVRGRATVVDVDAVLCGVADLEIVQHEVARACQAQRHVAAFDHRPGFTAAPPIQIGASGVPRARGRERAAGVAALVDPTAVPGASPASAACRVAHGDAAAPQPSPSAPSGATWRSAEGTSPSAKPTSSPQPSPSSEPPLPDSPSPCAELLLFVPATAVVVAAVRAVRVPVDLRRHPLVPHRHREIQPRCTCRAGIMTIENAQGSEASQLQVHGGFDTTSHALSRAHDCVCW